MAASDSLHDERERIASERERVANERDRVADERDTVADQRETASDARDLELDEKERRLANLEQALDERGRTLREAVPDDAYRFSLAGERRLRGVREPVRLFRVRRMQLAAGGGERAG